MASTASFSHCRIETASIKRNLLASKVSFRQFYHRCFAFVDFCIWAHIYFNIDEFSPFLTKQKFNLVKLVQRPVAVRSLKSNDAEKVQSQISILQVSSFPTTPILSFSSLIFRHFVLSREID